VSFGLDRYSKVRPMLYHLTARQNIEHIQTLGRLMSTEMLSRAADQEVDLETRRYDTIAVSVDSSDVFIRDQGRCTLATSNSKVGGSSKGSWSTSTVACSSGRAGSVDRYDTERIISSATGRKNSPFYGSASIRYANTNHWRCRYRAMYSRSYGLRDLQRPGEGGLRD
jgi:hypothetical protein